MKKNNLVDGFINRSPKEIQVKLQTLRNFIKSKIPGAIESISYGVPAYKLNGKPVIYFAGYKNHIAIYSAPRDVLEFKEELSKYKGGKGTIQFPNNEALNYNLIGRIIDFRLKQN